jgi:predicted ester cyclase
VPHVRRDRWQQIRKAHASGKSRPFGDTHEASGCDLDSPGTRSHDGQMATSITGLIERFYGELWNKWNDSAVDDTLSPDFRFRGSLGRETSGRQGWRQYRDLVHAGSADFRNEIVDLVCEGERVAVRLRYTGTLTGLLLGLPATQRRFEYAGAAFFTADHRWLTSAWVLGDLDGLRSQLG